MRSICKKTNASLSICGCKDTLDFNFCKQKLLFFNMPLQKALFLKMAFQNRHTPPALLLDPRQYI